MVGTNTGRAQAENLCGPLQPYHRGPYEYRTEPAGTLRIVECEHLSSEIDTTVPQVGRRNIYPESNIDHALKASPNHHSTPIAVIQLKERCNAPQAPEIDSSVQCLPGRGLRFQPDDTAGRVLYASLPGRKKRKPEGIVQLDLDIHYVADNPISSSGSGLAYLELGDPERALKQTQSAAELGSPRTEPADTLKHAVKWREPGQ